jgi:putative endonuclease
VWFVYLVECCDKTLYCGTTNNLNKRLHAHNNLKSGAKYTRTRRPVKLIYFESFATKSLAMRREYAIKNLSKVEKQNLVKKSFDSTL